MKKIFAALVACIMLIAAVTVFAETRSDANPITKDPVQLEGYSIGDSNGNTLSKWIGFTDADPSNVDIYSFSLTTYGAAYYDGNVYGYVYGYDTGGTLLSDFYVMNAKTHVVSYPGGSSNGEFVFGMAYSRTDGVMYALVDEEHPYIAAVDLETGALTRVVDIQLGSYLGLMTLAVDGNGDLLTLTMSALNSRLLSIDLTSGALNVVGETGLPCYYAQSMTYDHATGMIYWAQCESPTSSGLYRMDPATAQCEPLGVIGPDGIEVTCLYVLPADDEPEPTPGPTPEPTMPPTPPDPIPGDVDLNGAVEAIDALMALRSAMGVLELNEWQTLAGDVDGNGSVEVIDALTILRMAMGLI